MKSNRIDRKHWGEFTDGTNFKIENKLSDIILPKQKGDLESQLNTIKPEPLKNVITVDNPLVTQTIEVMNQTEMIQSLIDTYATKTDTNYELNPGTLMPGIDMPPDTTANLMRDEKFVKPLWYMPQMTSNFVKGRPKNYPKITKSIANDAMRKSISGLLRMKGYNECTESALVMFVDGLDEFYKSLLARINNRLEIENRDRVKTLDIPLLESSYFSLTNSSLISLHNYFKNDIFIRNQCEIGEFKDTFQEYDRLMQMQESHQKREDINRSIMDFSSLNGTIQYDGIGNITSFLDGVSNIGFRDIYDPNRTDTSNTDEM